MVREHGGDGEIVVPPTIHALLQARIDSLDGDVRMVMERGAVEGEVFHRGAVAELVTRSGARRRRVASDDPRPQGADPLDRSDVPPGRGLSASAISSSATLRTSRYRRRRVPSSTSGSPTGSRGTTWSRPTRSSATTSSRPSLPHRARRHRPNARGARTSGLPPSGDGRAVERWIAVDFNAGRSLLRRAVDLLPAGRRGEARAGPGLLGRALRIGYGSGMGRAGRGAGRTSTREREPARRFRWRPGRSSVGTTSRMSSARHGATRRVRSFEESETTMGLALYWWSMSMEPGSGSGRRRPSWPASGHSSISIGPATTGARGASRTKQVDRHIRLCAAAGRRIDRADPVAPCRRSRAAGGGVGARPPRASPRDEGRVRVAVASWCEARRQAYPRRRADPDRGWHRDGRSPPRMARGRRRGSRERPSRRDRHSSRRSASALTTRRPRSMLATLLYAKGSFDEVREWMREGAGPQVPTTSVNFLDLDLLEGLLLARDDRLDEAEAAARRAISDSRGST